MFDFALRVFDQLEEVITDVSTSPWFLVLLFVVAFSDSIVPLVPSEFTVIAGGVSASNGTLLDDRPEMSLVLVILLGSLGAYCGDSLSYGLGRGSGKVIRRIFFRGEKGKARIERTNQQIRKRGGLLLITARFIPGGRTATTFGCGLTRQPFLAWFSKWDILATTLWAGYAAGLGFFVADRVENQSTALWLAFGLALSLTLMVELARWLIDRRRSIRAAR